MRWSLVSQQPWVPCSPRAISPSRCFSFFPLTSGFRDASEFHPSPSHLPCWRFFLPVKQCGGSGEDFTAACIHARTSPLGGVTSPRSLHANLPNDGIPKNQPATHVAPFRPGCSRDRESAISADRRSKGKNDGHVSSVGVRRKQDRRKYK